MPSHRSAAALKADKENLPAIFGSISGIVVNEVFESAFGPAVLKAGGDCSEMFAGTELFLAGRCIATVGDGRTVLSAKGNSLEVAVCLNANLDGVKETVEAIEEGGVTLFATASGEPDRWELIDGQRVAILDEWGLSRIEFGDVEVGQRGTCRVK
jgi:hypothetical protein